jgi:excisionase family DNA binding protein
MNSVSMTFPDELIEAIALRVAAQLSDKSQTSPLLTVDEAAEYLRCKPKRVYDLCSQRRIEFVKDGSRTLIRRTALDKYLEAEA